MKLEILSGKKIREIHQMLKHRFGFDRRLDYNFSKSGKGRIWVYSKEVDKIRLKDLNVEAIGLYFCFREMNGLRLSIEGAQLIGKYAKKNVIELDEEQVQRWIRGFDLDVEEKLENGYVILKFGKDIIGCGKYKNGKLLNIVRKGRRIKKL
jgi:NOL1/NOP2/fmu family ribosome biogenesis protein